MELAVYNITGQKVRTLASSPMRAGIHKLVWDGCDDRGATVSSGVYISRLKMGKQVTSQQMTLIK